MKIIGQMSHESMVSATGAGTENGIHYLAMELVDGVDLGKVVRQCGPLSVADACELVRQASLGIQYAHDQGVIHRDVKPSNLMLAENSVVKVLDLGLATLGGLNGAVDELTTVGQLMGTLDYMAPEQCGDMHEVGARTDIYGLGATLYKLLCGVAPYSSAQNDTALKKLKAMAISEPIPIGDRTTKVPDALVQVIKRCLSRNPSDRFDSAKQLAVELAAFTQGNDLPALLEKARITSDESGTNASPLSSLRQSFTGAALPSSRSARPVNSDSKQAIAGAKSARGWGGYVKTVLFLAFAGLVSWGGIVLYINTSTGQLVIESEVDDISVSVLKNDKPAAKIEIEHGSESTRLTAGEYQIVINGDSDSLTIENEQFLLKRGGKVIVRIKEKPHGGLVVDSQSKKEKPDNKVTIDFEKQLCQLLLDRTSFYESLGDSHPATKQLDELIQETEERIKQNQTTISFYEKELLI